MRNGDNIIHLEFTSGPNEGQHHYFGSITGIFDKFSSTDIKVSRHRIYEVDIEPGKPYQNRVCIIRKGEVYRKKSNRTAPVKVLRIEG